MLDTTETTKKLISPNHYRAKKLPFLLELLIGPIIFSILLWLAPQNNNKKVYRDSKMFQTQDESKASYELDTSKPVVSIKLLKNKLE